MDTTKIDPGLGVRSYIENDAGSKSIAAKTLQRHLRETAFAVKSQWLYLFATGGRVRNAVSVLDSPFAACIEPCNGF
jgi:hypothetical protein